MAASNRIPRLPAEEIMEETLEINGGEVRLKKNVGPLTLTQFMSNTKTGEVKGLIVGDDIYYWDSYLATHFQIADALGVKHDVNDRLFFWRTDNGNVLIDRSEPIDHPEGQLRKLARSPNMFFFGSDAKWKPGTELAA